MNFRLAWQFVLVLVIRVSSGRIPEETRHLRKAQYTPPLSTSTYHLSYLARDEIRATAKLQDLAEALSAALDVLNRYLSSWEELVGAGVEAEGFASHPLHAYALTKHVSLGWPHVEASLRALSNRSQAIDFLLGRTRTRGVPTGEDLATVAGGLARLHDYYSLNLTALAHAQLVSAIDAHPVPVGITPTALDLHRIGSAAVSHNVLNSGVDFLRAALDRWDGNASSARSLDVFDARVDLDDVVKTFKKATKIHDQLLEKKGSRSKLHSTHASPLNKTLARKKKYHKKEEVHLGNLGAETQGMKQYLRLCRGEDLRPVSTTSRLPAATSCRWTRNVVTLEEVVTPLRGRPWSDRAQDSWRGRPPSGPTADHWRASLGRALREVSRSPWAVAVNYGVGGHFSVHHDHVHLGLVKDRMLTFLMYLTDVPQDIHTPYPPPSPSAPGGRTVFPWVGAGVRPKRGSTLLWYNMNRAGVPDLRVQHGACPVLVGDKWVMNKWINYGGQFHTLPCIPGDPSAAVLRPLD
ncbi:putative prolyl 4-hydroxylase subunit alpha-1 isoform X1 [Penaeus vannamei]|uniref:procollagen-proline 4-dioxygenase n=1 Tax=Penaeus vannamei TaxID=6689 RepID=A0A3R7MJ96_PENVA|nr:putative prolyl 4-hydroxylase subunit alpha-1 isoform X1 [Penaeus vannamei]